MADLFLSGTFKVKSVLHKTKAMGMANMKPGDMVTVRYPMERTYRTVELTVINHQTNEVTKKYPKDVLNALSCYELTTVRNYIMKAVPTT